MKIGPYEIFSIETSRFALDGGAMFGIIPKSLWGKRISSDDRNRIPLTTRSLLLVGNGRNIIVDTGNGDKWNPKKRSIFKIDTNTVNIHGSLGKIGLAPEDVTDVVCTHLHFDHAGGNTRIDENGETVPTFPNATYWIQKNNWELANAPSVKDKGSYLPENWTVLAENEMVELIDGEEEFIQGIEVFVANGHTAGQQLPKVSNGSQTVFFCADLFPTVHHLSLPWVMAYDNYPLQTIKEKKAVLSTALEEEWILFFEHDMTHEAVTVKSDGKDYGMKNDMKVDGDALDKPV